MPVMLEIPEPIETLPLDMADGARIEVVRHGNPDGPRLMVSHGNGFATDGYFPFWRLALDRYDVVLFDFRNHGRNPFHGANGHDYATFQSDMDAVHRAAAQRWGAKATIGAFHSMAALTAMQTVVTDGGTWDALALFDPPVVPPPGHPLHEAMLADARHMSALVLRRNERFAEPAALARVFARAPRFRRWVPGAHALMARAILRPDPSGEGWTLACPKALEAPIYLGNETLDVWQGYGAWTDRMIILGADPEAEDADDVATACATLAAEHGIACHSMADTGHLLQIERPEACFAVVEDFLRSIGLAP